MPHTCQGLQEKTPAASHQNLRNGGAQCLDFQSSLALKNMRPPQLPLAGILAQNGNPWHECSLSLANFCLPVPRKPFYKSVCHLPLATFLHFNLRTAELPPAKTCRQTYLHYVRCTWVFPRTHDSGRTDNPITFDPNRT